jgi:hypothetical protein
MAAVIIGLCFIMISIIMTVGTKNSDARRTALMKTVSPNNNHPGVILYAKISRHVGSVAIFAMGVMCILGGFGFFND